HPRVYTLSLHDALPILRGPGMMPGYWRNEEATREAFLDGWLRTGDIGVLDEQGRLTYVDRLKDMIISGCLNISPLEIEQVIQTIDRKSTRLNSSHVKNS